MLTDVENSLVNTALPVPECGSITKVPATEPLESLTHIDCYMDEVISAVQGGTEIQQRVFDCTVRALNWIFL